MERRGKFEIYGDIISAVSEEASRTGEARLTRVQSTANIPYSRFKERVRKLEKQGLIRLLHAGDHVKVELTDSGKAYLREYEHVKKLVRFYGLE